MLTYCVVNTSQRELLMRGLDAVARERERAPFPTATLVLDNGSADGSAEAVRARRDADRIQLIALPRRRGKAANDSELMRRTRTRYCLLLNEDSELQPGASEALVGALEADPGAACASAQLLTPDGDPRPCAWRFPGIRTALAGTLFLHRHYTVQRAGRVDWAQSSALLVRCCAAEQVGWMDAAFFVYSDEVDFQKRLHVAGWHTLLVAEARAIHHEQLATASAASSARRIVQLARGRDRYVRKHHGAFAAWAVRWLTAWPYALRALAALVLPGHEPQRYWRHVAATLRPQRGVGLEEGAETQGERADA
ncbi:MAG: glycosyltransferase [Solirubrobacteraceae bacterium]